MPTNNGPIQITENLWMLGASQYPLYLFKGREEGAIFEGGIGSMGPLVLEQLDRLELSREFVRQLVVTHAHPDHVMAVPMLREAFPQVSILASEAAAKTLDIEKAVAFFAKLDDSLTGALVKAGMIGEEYRRPDLKENRIPVDRVLAEGDTVAIEDAPFAVLQTLGHSDCSLSFHEPDRGILIVSDATGYYMPDHDDWWPNYFADYGQYLESMRRLAGLNAQILCLSHNGVIQGADQVKAYFDGAIGATERYHERILDQTKAGKSVREIAEQLGSELYERNQLFPLDFFQKNCGLLVKLSLRHEAIKPDKRT